MTDDLRQRKLASENVTPQGNAKGGRAGTEDEDVDYTAITFVDILRLIGGLLLVNFLLSYFITGDSFTWGYRPWWIRPQLVMRLFSPPVILTDEQLLAYDGRDDSLPIYLGLNGTIYDVTAGSRTYGPGGPYNYFAGRDAARAFITGCFQEDANPDYRGAEWTYIPEAVPRVEEKSDAELSRDDVLYRRQCVDAALKKMRETIDGWASLFRGDTGKDYFEVGKIKRTRRWMEKLPRKPLCKAAERQRPKTAAAVKDPGAAYRGSGP